jgi:hypothetical protein
VVVEEVKNKLNDVKIVELIVADKEKLVEFVDVEDKLVLKISVNNDALIFVAVNVNVEVNNEGVRKVVGVVDGNVFELVVVETEEIVYSQPSLIRTSINPELGLIRTYFKIILSLNEC